MDTKKPSFHDLRMASRIEVTDLLPLDPVAIKVGGQKIATLGNISCSIGRPKAKKSFNLGAMAASVISNGQTILAYDVTLPEGKKNILVVDTEQSSYHCLGSLKTIIKTAGLSTEFHPSVLEFLSLRKFTPQERVSIIGEAIRNTDGLGLVFMDGIRDLVSDINSSEQANRLLNKLMEWSEVYAIHIHVVLHQNKGDLNARGHLGTELVNKSETVMEILHDADDNNSVVKPIYCRNKEFSPFAFSVNGDGITELDERYVDPGDPKQKFTYEDLTECQHIQTLGNVFKMQPLLNYADLIGELKYAYSRILPTPIGDNKTKSLKVFLENKRIILKEGKLYKLNGSYRL